MCRCQDWIELSVRFFTHKNTSVETANWFSHFKQLNTLVHEFWSQNFLGQSDCLILLHKIPPDRLDPLNSCFAMIETYWISCVYVYIYRWHFLYIYRWHFSLICSFRFFFFLEWVSISRSFGMVNSEIKDLWSANCLTLNTISFDRLLLM